MKLIYIVILFLLFFNIFSFMSAYLGIFPYEYGSESESYDSLNETGESLPPSDDVFYNVTRQKSMDVLGIFFGDLSDAGGILTTITIFGVAAVAAWLTHSTTPFVVAFLANTVRITYQNSMVVIHQYPINPFVEIALGVGVIFLIVITAAEYLSHGDV